MKLLFVGGPFHGQERDVEPMPPTSLVDVVTGEPEPPNQYVDAVSGVTYVLETMRVPVKAPLRNQPVGFFERDLYLLAALVGDQQQSHAALADALTRWWLSNGRRLTQQEAAARAEKAAAVPLIRYTAECVDCGAGAQFVFESLADRATFAAEHLHREPGHSFRFEESAERSPEGGSNPADNGRAGGIDFTALH